MRSQTGQKYWTWPEPRLVASQITVEITKMPPKPPSHDLTSWPAREAGAGAGAATGCATGAGAAADTAAPGMSSSSPSRSP
jgi:hypothetical protein